MSTALLLSQFVLFGLMAKGAFLSSQWPMVFIPTWVFIVLSMVEVLDFGENEYGPMFFLQYLLAALWAFGKMGAGWPVVFIPIWIGLFVSLIDALLD